MSPNLNRSPRKASPRKEGEEVKGAGVKGAGVKGAGVNHVKGRERVGGVLAGTKHELNQASDGVSKFCFAVDPNQVPFL